jgi:four helix bundle protein
MEYLRFLELAYGSAREVEYQTGLCTKLGYLAPMAAGELAQKCAEASKTLAGLIKGL